MFKKRILIVMMILMSVSMALARVDLNDPLTYGTAVIDDAGIFKIMEDVTFCSAGSFSTINNVAISIESDGVTLDCLGSTFNGPGGWGNNGGLEIRLKSGVIVQDCKFNNFNF